MRRIISILLQNEAGALARVAGMFSARGYNIDSLSVAATHDAAVSRLTLVTFGDDAVIDQIIKIMVTIMAARNSIRSRKGQTWISFCHPGRKGHDFCGGSCDGSGSHQFRHRACAAEIVGGIYAKNQGLVTYDL